MDTSTETTAAPAPARVSIIGKGIWPLLSYLLLLLAGVVGIVGNLVLPLVGGVLALLIALVAVVASHIAAGSDNPALASHGVFTYRTFWIGFLLSVLGGVLTATLIGAIVGLPILVVTMIWVLLRYLSGLVRLLLGRGIGMPTSLLFG